MPDPRSLDACLSASPSLSQVLAHARLLAKAQTVFQSAVPRNLAAASRVANIRGGILVIHADHSAVAAKLRQLSGRLSRELLSQGIECTGVDIAVQASSIPPQIACNTHEPLSEAARQSLRRLAESLPADSDLRDPVARLAGEQPKTAGQ